MKDAGLIGCARLVAHYEMAGYGTLMRYAEILGKPQHLETLRLIEQEEWSAEQLLSHLSRTLDAMAAQA